jgi:hypothetical protein
MSYSHPDPEDLFGAIGSMTIGEVTVVLAEFASLMITDQLRVEYEEGGGVVRQIRPDSPALRPLIDALEDFDVGVMGYEEGDDAEESLHRFLKDIIAAKDGHPSSDPAAKFNLGLDREEW